MPTRKSNAYVRKQAQNKARREAFKVYDRDDPSNISYLTTLVAYIRSAVDDGIKNGLHFQAARVKEIIVRTRRATLRRYEIRNRGRIYEVTIEDKGKITGISREDIEYGGTGEDDEYDETDTEYDAKERFGYLQGEEEESDDTTADQTADD
jgi:hypothetical protein